MRLSLGNGPSPRLLAPGRPDWIGTDGVRVGWTLRDRLFLLDGDGVRVVELPDIAEDVAATPRRWTVALGSGFVRIDPATGRVEELLLDDEAEPVATWPGEELGLFVEVPENRLLRLVDGRLLPIPDGALRARWLRPWGTGVGACWIDLDVLIRMGARVSALGRIAGAEGIACGPMGAVIAQGRSDTLVAAPSQLAVRLGQVVDAASARFAPDGLSALAACADGVVLFDLTTGEITRSWEGSYAPVGFAPGPVIWDLDAGVLVGEGFALDGLAAADPATAGGILAGPGGAVWDLSTGEPVRRDLRDGVCATDGVSVVHVDDTRVRVLGGATYEHGLCADEDAVDTARIEGDTLVVTTLDGEVGRFALADGVSRGRSRRAGRPPAPPAPPAGVTLSDPDEDSYTHVGDTTFPLPGDAAATVGDEVWVWTAEGALYALPAR